MNNNDSNTNKRKTTQLQEVTLSACAQSEAEEVLLHEFRLKGIPKPTEQLMPDIRPPLQD